MDCSPPGSSVYGILQARILEWVAISSFRGFSRPKDWTCVSYITGRFFTIWATRKAQYMIPKWKRGSCFHVWWCPLFPLPTLDTYHQFSSVTQSYPTLCDPMNRSMPGLPVHHQLPEFTQTHVHWVGDAIQPFHPLSSPFPPAPNPSQHQSLFQRVNSSHEVAKLLELLLQHQFFPWIFSVKFL